MARRKEVLDRDTALDLLRNCKAAVSERYGVLAIGLFGSLSRNQSSAASDIDVVVQLADPDLFTLVHIKEELEAAFHRHVDIVQYRDRMNPYLKRRIEQEAVYV